MAELVCANADTRLVLLDRAKTFLARARHVPEVKDLRYKAAAIERYWRQKQDAAAAWQDACEIKLRAEWRLGQLLADQVSAGNPQLLHAATIGKLPAGVNRCQSHRWQLMAKIPEPDFDRRIEQLRRTKGQDERTSGTLSTATFVRLGKQYARMEHRRAKARRQPQLSDRVRAGDFRCVLGDMDPDSVDLIFTDPPYQKTAIPLYGDLAQFAARVLRPGGSLVTYCGQYALFDIGPLVTPHLRYQWCFGVRHSGGRRRLHGWRVRVGWKPLLWFVKGRYEGGYVHDALDSQANDKADHDWAQGHAEAAYVIEHLSPVGGLVVDPLAGGGTTLLAAIRLGRRALGAEIDPTRAGIANSTIERATKKPAVCETA